MRTFVLSALASGLVLGLSVPAKNQTKVGDTEVLIEAAAFTSVSTTPSGDKAQSWYADGAAAVAQAVDRTVNNTPGAARNVILFIGDGMGVSTVTAARILQGQMQGKLGEEHQLSFEKFPYAGLVKTYNTNQQTPDSAGTMTAMMTGVKTKAGVINVSEASLRGDAVDYLRKGEPLLTALELAEVAGKATGIVSTTRITHATPAATFAKIADRDWEDDGDFLKGEAGMGVMDIARQLVEFETLLESRLCDGSDHPNIDGIDVVLGGGRRSFFQQDPADLTGFAERAGEGDRKDGRNLIEEWKADGGIYVMDRAGFDALDRNSTARVLGLFNESHMRYEADRHKDAAGEPSLSEMTEKAIELLQRDEDGFFLMVEGGRIDHAHHSGSAYNALTDTIEMATAVAKAVENTDPEETLIIVTADHGHSFTIAGYPTRGNPILGKVVSNDSTGEPRSEPSVATDSLPYTTLGYTNGRGFANLGDETNADARYRAENADIATGRKDLSEVAVTAPGYHQEALVPTALGTHTGEDVTVHASGPGAHLVTGTIEQNVIFHVMNHAADLVNRAEAQLNGGVSPSASRPQRRGRRGIFRRLVRPLKRAL